MIDIHSHVLPAIDDGAKDVSESLLMLRDSRDQGVELCVATPHVTVHRESSIPTFLEKREASIAALEQGMAGQERSMPVLRYGAEIFLDNDISLYDDVEKLCITGTKYMLIELATGAHHPHVHEWIYSLYLKGILPILAHVERYPYFEKLWYDLEGIPVIYQINSSAVLTRAGKKLLYTLYDGGNTVVVSGDMHNMGQRRSFMKKAYGKISKKSPEMAEMVFKAYAEKIFEI